MIQTAILLLASAPVLAQDVQPASGNNQGLNNPFAIAQPPAGQPAVQPPPPPARISPTAGSLWSVRTASKEELDFLKRTNKAMEKLKTAQMAEEKAAAKQELKEVLEKHFAYRLKLQEEQLRQVEERVRKLRDQFEKRRSAKDQIIDLRLQTLVNQASGLGFFDGAAATPTRSSGRSSWGSNVAPAYGSGDSLFRYPTHQPPMSEPASPSNRPTRNRGRAR